MKTRLLETKKKRNILSVDLDAYPDVRDSLALACEASGNTPTKLAIESMRRAPPAVLGNFSRLSAEAAARLNSSVPPGEAAAGPVAVAALTGRGPTPPVGGSSGAASSPARAGRTAKARQQ